MKIKIEVTMSGNGRERKETIEIHEEELRQYACRKARENDDSHRIFAEGRVVVEI